MTNLYTSKLVISTTPPKVRRGYVTLRGQKILIQIREGNTSNYATIRKDGGLDGEHFTKAEEYLKTRAGHGALARLLDGKMIPL